MITNEQIDLFIAAAHRAGNAELLLCSSGNLSWKIGNQVLLTGTGSWVPKLKKEDITICNLADGSIVQGVKSTSESGFHLGVLRNREDRHVVLHFQSKYATVIACMKNRPSNYNVTAEVALYCGKEIPVVPYLRPGSPELARAVTVALTDHDCAIMEKHGQVVCGKDLDDAFQKAMFFEMGCRILVLSGFNYQPLTEEEIADLEYYILGKK